MDIESLLQDIVGEVKDVSGVKAIVLGGSRARGTNQEIRMRLFPPFIGEK